MARPKKDKTERRTEQVNFRLTATDKLALLKFAQQDNKQPYSLAREIIESYIQERKERITPDEKLIRFSGSVYKEIERQGKHVNGVTKAYHSQPDRPPHPQKMAGMIDKLEGLASRLEKDWPPQLVYDFTLYNGLSRIINNLGQMQDNYTRLNMRFPDRLKQITERLIEIMDRIGLLQ